MTDAGWIVAEGWYQGGVAANRSPIMGGMESQMNGQLVANPLVLRTAWCAYRDGTGRAMCHPSRSTAAGVFILRLS